MKFSLHISKRFRAIATLGLAFIFSGASHCFSQEARKFELKLWEKGAPGALGTAEKDIPKLMVSLPASDKITSALVICPGGGYGGLAMDHEGHQIAQWANDIGMAAIICDYRHRGKGYGHPAPSDDAKRAVQTVRSNAESWNIDPSKVGMIGFSAGGHLTSTVLTQYSLGDENAADPIERFSSRPDFGILCYPVILFGHPKGHKGSEKNLLGDTADEDLLKSFQSAARVTKDTPPTFLFHTYEDKPVPAENSLEFYAAMVREGVPGELHFYEKGPHGVGLAKTIPGTSDWPQALQRWLSLREIVEMKP